MTTIMEAIRYPEGRLNSDPDFPHAPADWSRRQAERVGHEERLTLTPDHFDVVRALQRFYFDNADAGINARELHDALAEKFHGKGGLRHLYVLFPGGPIAQGCRVAGLKAPTRALDKGFGSVA